MINLHKIRQEICEIGDRLYKKGFAAANDGNIDLARKTGRLHPTGSAKASEARRPCMVDMEAQTAGRRKATSGPNRTWRLRRSGLTSNRSSTPSAHATAFGTPEPILPRCRRSDLLGDVPIAKYDRRAARTSPTRSSPSSWSSVISHNHGTVSFGETVEKAYWATEILDAYCRTLILAKSPRQGELLHRVGSRAPGPEDPVGLMTRGRNQNCELCANADFRESWKESGVERCAFQPPVYHPDRQANPAADQETLIQAITDRVMAAMDGRKG